MDELLAKHRKEQKDLQSQITQKKKSASKKTRKNVNDECARLEQELKARQESEITALQDPNGNGEFADSAVDQDTLLDSIAAESSLEQKTQDLSLSETTTVEAVDVDDAPQRKPNRQKARLARRAAEQEAIAATAAEEAAALPDRKQVERDRMLAEFEQRGLQEKVVAANGHCMYSAVADQMRQLGLDLSIEGNPSTASQSSVQANDYKAVRSTAASYISNHPDDFAAFLEEPLEEHVHKVRDTAEWGGQLELLALAKAYTITINVLQGEGRLERIEAGEDEARGEAWLAYYRHGFGLGEHYNSLRKERKTAKDEEG